ncbi:MAG: hypothetical protein IT436_06095 [Phycisphaerales bacterium]|nr:hypothetical protein [Phycisphaerales bacterium]
MSALARQSDSPFSLADRPAEVTQLMDEHHIVACSADPRKRAQFGASLGQFLSTMRDTEVVALQGRAITDLESFCQQLERALPGPALERRIHGLGGVVNLMRHRQTFGMRTPSKFRFYIWHDADTLLRSDPMLFGHLTEAIAGVAAEAEYVCDDVLMIHRGLFIGGPDLDRYADLPNGQCRAWVNDDQGEPFWQVVTGIEQPSFLKYDIETGKAE